MAEWVKSLKQRIGWHEHIQPFLYKKLPPGLGPSAVLGSLCALVFAVMIVSGMCLALYYSPSPETAYQSLDFITGQIPGGRILRGIHHWGAGALVILVFLHLGANYFTASYKAPREINWLTGIGLLLLTLGLGFTGYLLPWDQKAYWATVVSSNIPKDIPLVGDLLSRLLLAGSSVSGLTLTRFFALHVLVLPAALAAFTVVHIYLVRLHGVAEPPVSDSYPNARPHRTPNRLHRFFPEHLVRCAVAFVLVLAVILILAVWADVPREQIAGTIDEDYLPRPEWYYMWLFQLLTYFPGDIEAIGSLVIPAAALALLLALPFLDRRRARAAADRPLAVAFGVMVIVGVVYLTMTGFAGARPYGQATLVPDRKLSAGEALGLRTFVEKDCAYCHHINGRYGRRVGPDLLNVRNRDRTPEYLMDFIRNPQTIDRWSTMPKYELDEKTLRGLAEFVLAVGDDKTSLRPMERDEILGLKKE